MAIALNSEQVYYIQNFAIPEAGQGEKMDQTLALVNTR